jgi:hypothetical protein
VANRDQITGLDLDPHDRRRALIAVTDVFSRGYAQATRPELVHASGLDPVTFDALFADPEDCFLQAYGYAIASAREPILGSFPPNSSWPVRLAAGLRTAIGMIDAHPAEASLVLIEAQRASAATSARHLATIESLAPFFEEGRALASADPRLPEMLDMTLPAGIACMLASNLKSHPHEPAIRLYPEALRFGLLPYLGDRKAASFVSAASQVVDSAEPN